MLEHLEELRNRVIKIFLVFITLCILSYCFSYKIYNALVQPFIDNTFAHNGADAINLVMTEIMAPFNMHIQLSFICGIGLSMPYILYQLWQFIRPGLYAKEVRIIGPLLIFSCMLFYLGMLFGYFVLVPVALQFFVGYRPQDVSLLIDVGKYLDFLFTISVVSGVVFQIPIITHILLRTGLISRQTMLAKRRHVIVAAFVLGMLLAPPDVLSQVLLALPMWGLFELGLLLPHRAQKELVL